MERKYMAHYLDASFGTLTPDFSLLGEDLEEFNVELNPDTEVKKNILGQTTFVHNGYEPSSEVSPYYAKQGDPLFERLQEIVDTRASGDACKTECLEVHLWEGDKENGFTAWKQPCYVVPTSYGGDTSGYQIPFTISYVGERVKGKFIPETKAFIADTETTTETTTEE